MNKKFLLMILVLVSTKFADKPNDWMHYHLNGLGSDWMIGGVEEDIKGDIWTGGLALFNIGIIHLPTEAIINCNSKLVVKRKTSNDIIEIVSHSNGDLWFFCQDSFFIYKSISPDSLIYSGDYNGRTLLEIHAIENRDGDIYLGSRDYLFLIETNGRQLLPFSTPGTNDALKPDFVDSEGNIWFFGNGIYKYNGDTWRHFTKNNSGLESNSFHLEGHKIVQDSADNIIAATWDRGLFIYDGIKWTPYAGSLPEEGFTNITNIAIDSSGGLWVDFSYYIGRYMGGEWVIYNEEDFYTHRAPVGNAMSEIMVDSKNRVWFAGRHCGLFMLNQDTQNSCQNKKRIKITTPGENSIWDNNIYYDIQWESWGYIHSVNLKYDIHENNEWVPINSNDRPIENAGKTNWRTPNISSNRYRLRIFSIDDSSIADTTGFFTIAADGQNLPPTLQNIPDSLEAKSEETTSWTAQATDPEGDPVTFTFTDLPSWAMVSQSTLTLEPTRSDSSTTVQVIAADTNGGADTADIYIAVIHSTTTERGVGAAGPSANMLHVEKMKINLPAGKIKRVTLFNVQGKMIATADTNIEYANLFRITRNITDSFVVAKIEYADKTSVQRAICLME